MSIPHLQDLPVRHFLNVVQRMSEYRITEKVDGTALIVGVDEDNQFYTSREAKNGSRCYYDTDYTACPANESFIAAHQFLQAEWYLNKHALPRGTAYEVEVLFGRQPNAVVYGSNKIVLLRPLENDAGVMSPPIDAFMSKWKGGRWSTNKGFQYTSYDGITIECEDQLQRWSVVAVPEVDYEPFTRVDLEITIGFIERWLEETYVVGSNTFSNEELLNVNLTQIPKGDRELVKESREENRIAVARYKAAGAKFYLRIVRNIQSKLLDVELKNGEDIGIEGVVCLHPETGEQFKIVNKEEFTSINCFNHMVRNAIRKTSHSTMSDGADLRGSIVELQGMELSVYDEFLKTLASNIWPFEGLTSGMMIKRELRKHAGVDVAATTKALTGKIANETHVLEVRQHVGQACERSLGHLNAMRRWYLDEVGGFGLVLVDEKWIGYSRAVHHRTLLVMADLQEELEHIQDMVRYATTKAEIMHIVFRKQLNSIH